MCVRGVSLHTAIEIEPMADKKKSLRSRQNKKRKLSPTQTDVRTCMPDLILTGGAFFPIVVRMVALFMHPPVCAIDGAWCL
jgi:hypothetical protein